ncbi:MAG: class II fructose-bisphosphate aldolase [Candidatus Diapherotrites archaeon]|nr:class II fructose-bisphosphate aldolase [Candidatus Micrarchaeota archaeon]MBU1939712.1 class II fructose-bisphosphate aldolase [Candidatus Micrarchaeota archaeon]
MADTNFRPMPGAHLFRALHGTETIIMACNTRATIGVCEGIFRAAKECDAAVMMELAKSESDLNGGYTGLKPADYAKRTTEAAEKAGFDVWALHADHTTVKKGTPEEIAGTKELITAQVNAGYTSFAMDASFLFNEEGADVREELARNVEVTTDLVRHLQSKIGAFDFGLEVEVGEIGKKDEHGRVLTTPEEAVHFITELHANDVKPHGLAIANGSAHGNAYDAGGNLVPQLSVDIPQTIAVGKALEENGLGVSVVQHGITGTPLEIIAEKFPRQYIIKGNVGTYWQNLMWDVFKEREQELFNDIKNWVLEKYGSEAREKGLEGDAVFGTYSKNAYKEFFDRIYGIGEETEREIESRAYEAAKEHFRAFGAKGSAKKVREMREKGD